MKRRIDPRDSVEKLGSAKGNEGKGGKRKERELSFISKDDSYTYSLAFRIEKIHNSPFPSNLKPSCFKKEMDGSMPSLKTEAQCLDGPSLSSLKDCSGSLTDILKGTERKKKKNQRRRREICTRECFSFEVGIAFALLAGDTNQ